MFNVAFWFDAPVEYSGGLNYIRNLLYAVSLVNDRSVRPFIFFSTDISENIAAQFAPYASVVRTNLLRRRSLPWLAHKLLYKLAGSMFLANVFLKRHGIAVLSHVWFEYKGRAPFRLIGWIPDFQYLHLPELFPTLDSEAETRRNQRIISQSDAVILSSFDALDDFKRIALPETRSRATVLQFVSQPRSAPAAGAVSREGLERKYGFSGRFFFLPNQFWAHKNHMVVLHAVKLLRDSGIDVLVLCTGNTRDYRSRGSASTQYIESVFEFIEMNRLRDHVKILGQIDYDDVLVLMKNSLAVLNPSRFEGWSSSVEEAKSMGKPIILSRIGVHVEQAPPGGRYFEPNDAVELAKILGQAWTAPVDASEELAAQKAREALRGRTAEFGSSYLALVKAVAGSAGVHSDFTRAR